MTKIIVAAAVGAVSALVFNAVADAVNGTNTRAYRAKDGRLYDHRETPEEYDRRQIREALACAR